mgnify:CR=1 FL=1
MLKGIGEFIILIVKAIASLFNRNKENTLPRPLEPLPSPPPDPVLTIPHPEEPMNPNATMENTSIRQVLIDWMTNWNVPIQYQPFWFDAINIKLVDASVISYAAGVYELDGKRFMNIRPEFLNTGVLCHEQCHNSYALLTEDQKNAFEITYKAVEKEPYIVLLHKVNTYMDTLDQDGRHVEGHAEIGRYIGFDKMPDELKIYYPKLL